MFTESKKTILYSFERQLGIIAADLLGRKRPFAKSSIRIWRLNEAESRRQLEGVKTKDSQKVKYLQPPDVHDFAEELSKILVTFGLSLTNATMLDQARILKETKYPGLKKRGRKGEKDIKNSI